MKKIGIIGGLSWQSTVDYYKIINEESNRRLGNKSTVESIIYSTDMEETYWTCFYRVPTFGNFCCSFGITTATGIDDDHCIVNEDGSVDYIRYNMSGSDFSVSMVAPLGFNGKFKDYTFDVSRMTETDRDSYLVLDANGKLLNEDEQTAADLAIYREALPELMEFIEVTNTVTGVQ